MKSSPPSRKSSDTSGKKCYACQTAFGIRKKRICKYCMNAFCSEHCQRERVKDLNGPALPICDFCSQSLIAKDIEAELDLDLESLQSTLIETGSTTLKLGTENSKNISTIVTLESDLAAISTTFESKLQALEEKFNEEVSELKQISEVYDSKKEAFDKAKSENKAANDKFNAAKDELNGLKKQAEILIDTKAGVERQLERINSRLKGSLQIEQVQKLLCENCAQRASEASKKRIDTPSILEDATISMESFDERQSIMQSVREYKEILSNQDGKVEENPKCRVF